MKKDRSNGAYSALQSFLDLNCVYYMPLHLVLMLVYKHCPVSVRNDVFERVSRQLSLRITILDDNRCICDDMLFRFSRHFVNYMELVRIPNGLSSFEKHDYLRITICDYIYSKFYSMFN